MSNHAAWMTHRSMTADPSVKAQKLKPGTVKRIFEFARPYRTSILIFLGTVVVDAALVVTTPLLLLRLIDDGVIPKNGTLITKLAILVGLLAIADAAMSMLGRYFSSRIGEGLIYDLR
ncbi:MAG: ABC transporter ATP-binding protein, partial [Actinobacteria bacterium]|nr:ABC transporter ATP-binding protein [Actinomycetota bacterium]